MTEAQPPREHTDEELKQIAMDLCDGRIFCSAQIDRPDLISMVFMPLALLPQEDVAVLRDRNVVFVYDVRVSR